MIIKDSRGFSHWPLPVRWSLPCVCVKIALWSINGLSRYIHAVSQWDRQTNIQTVKIMNGNSRFGEGDLTEVLISIVIMLKILSLIIFQFLGRLSVDLGELGPEEMSFPSIPSKRDQSNVVANT